MSYDVFLEEKVTAAIYETGVGGEYDATNVVEMPIATGITRLGIDHERVLRVPTELRPTYFTLEARPEQQEKATIEEIAWHKSGIFKTGCPAFSVQQQPLAREVLCCRATEGGAPLTFVEISPELAVTNFPSEVQRENAALAKVLLDSDPRTRADHGRIPKEVLRRLKDSRLDGRCQILKAGADEWYIDGAHTEDSLIVASRWFAEHAKR